MVTLFTEPRAPEIDLLGSKHTSKGAKDLLDELAKKQPDGRLELDYDPEITNSLAESKPGLLTRIVMWRVFSSLKKIPLLVVRGGESDILSQKIAARMIRRHKDAELAVVPGRGHAPMLDEPAAVSAISAFLKRIETQS